MKKECTLCFGTGVIQPNRNIGYYGVCKKCDGDGNLYFIESIPKYGTKDEWKRMEQDDCFWDD